MLPKTARYRTQFRNGVWQVFDRVYYGVVSAHDLQRHADAAAARLNARHAAQ